MIGLSFVSPCICFSFIHIETCYPCCVFGWINRKKLILLFKEVASTHLPLQAIFLCSLFLRTHTCSWSIQKLKRQSYGKLKRRTLTCDHKHNNALMFAVSCVRNIRESQGIMLSDTHTCTCLIFTHYSKRCSLCEIYYE